MNQLELKICPTWLIMYLWYVLSRSVIGSVTVYLGLSMVWVKLGEWKKGRVRWNFVYFHVQVKCLFTSIFLCYYGNFSLPIYCIPLKVYSSIKKGSHKSVKVLYTLRTGFKFIYRHSTSHKKMVGLLASAIVFKYTVAHLKIGWIRIGHLSNFTPNKWGTAYVIWLLAAIS